MAALWLRLASMRLLLLSTSICLQGADGAFSCVGQFAPKLPERLAKPLLSLRSFSSHMLALCSNPTPRTVSEGRGLNKGVLKEACIMTPWLSGEPLRLRQEKQGCPEVAS